MPDTKPGVELDKRGVCNAWYACLIASPSGMIPFAVAKKLALTKFLMCVTGD